MINNEDVNKSNFIKQHIFNNRLIKYKNKVLFFPNWADKGIEKFYDIINCQEKRLLTVKEIQDLIGHNANIVFQHNALINAVPKQWISWLREEEVQQNDEMNVNPTCMAGMYNTKIRNIKKIDKAAKIPTVPIANEIWTRKLGFNLDSKSWNIATETTTESRLRVLQ